MIHGRLRGGRRGSAVNPCVLCPVFYDRFISTLSLAARRSHGRGEREGRRGRERGEKRAEGKRDWWLDRRWGEVWGVAEGKGGDERNGHMCVCGNRTRRGEDLEKEPKMSRQR